jgi:hypothetical protein
MQRDYYAMIMQNKKNKQKLIGVLFWVATIDTTNKGSRPEIPLQPKGERGELPNLLAHR